MRAVFANTIETVIKMTEQLKPTSKINYDHAQVHLAILGHREKYLVTAKNHSTGEVKNYNLIQKEIITKAEELNN